jgi:hypothetical protein
MPSHPGGGAPAVRCGGLFCPPIPFVLGLILVLGEIPGCTRVSDDRRFPATDEKLQIVETVPAQDAEEVSPDTHIDICFSGRVDPRPTDDWDATVMSGRVTFDSQLELQLVPWRGPGGLELPQGASARWCTGSVLSIKPLGDLRLGLLYRVQLRPTVVGWEGESLDTDATGWQEVDEEGLRYILEFTAAAEGDDGSEGTGTSTEGDTDGGDGPGEGSESPGLSDLFETDAVLDPDRGTCGCHVPDGPRARDVAHTRLDLSDPAAAHENLLESSRLRDTGFPMVTARSPSESFLVHKLLRDGDSSIHGVLGDPMPPDRQLEYPQLVSIMRWIEGGAAL